MVWNISFFPYIGNVIIPTDELIFFRGVAKNHQPDYNHGITGGYTTEMPRFFLTEIQHFCWEKLPFFDGPGGCLAVGSLRDLGSAETLGGRRWPRISWRFRKQLMMMRIQLMLVGGFKHFLMTFHSVGNSNPNLTSIFFRGVGIPPTRMIFFGFKIIGIQLYNDDLVGFRWFLLLFWLQKWDDLYMTLHYFRHLGGLLKLGTEYLRLRKPCIYSQAV